MTATRSLRLGVYLRVSSEDQAERGTIATQADQIKHWLAVHREFAEIDRYVDDGVSGMIPLSQRTAGARLVRDAASGRLNAVLVYQVDRLGRDAVDLLGVRRLFKSLGVRLLSVVEGEPDLLGFDVQAVVGDHYRREFLRKSADGMTRAAQEGRYCGGIVPYGFRVAGQKQNAHLVPDDTPVVGDLSAAGVIRRVFDRLGLGHVSCTVVADELNTLASRPITPAMAAASGESGPAGAGRQGGSGTSSSTRSTPASCSTADAPGSPIERSSAQRSRASSPLPCGLRPRRRSSGTGSARRTPAGSTSSEA